MDYNYSYSYSSSSLDSADVGVLIGLLIFWLVGMAGGYVLMSIFMGKLFKKAGVSFGKAWIPIYNMVKFFQIGGQNPLHLLWMLTGFGSIATVVFMCIAAYNIGLKLGKSEAWVVLYIFVSPVWLGICGLDKSVWNESLGAPSRAPETAQTAYANQNYQQNNYQNPPQNYPPNYQNPQNPNFPPQNPPNFPPQPPAPIQ